KHVGPVRRQPPPGSKAAPEPTIPPGGAALARAWRKITPRGKPLIPGPVSMGPVRCQPPPGSKAAPESTIPPGGAARARAWGEITPRGKPLIPGPVSM
ncbi:hypothetical protein ACLBQT_30040, partial [Klebsiella pneumoniae]